MSEKPKQYWQRIWGLPSDVAKKNDNGHFMSAEHLDEVMGQWYERGKKDGHHASFREGVEYVGKRLREEEEKFDFELDEHAPGYYIIYRLLQDMNAIKARPEKEADNG